MSRNLPVRQSLLGLSTDRATGRALATIQTGAFLERAEDEARLALASARMHDVGIATHHAFDEGEGMVSDFCRRVGDDPLRAQALAPFLDEGLRGVHRQLRRVSGEGW